MKKYLSLLVIFFLWTVVCGLSTQCGMSNAFAAVPHLINYQGRVTNISGDPLIGSYDFTFRIFDAETAGNLLWEETQPGIVVDKGLFGVLLGSVAALNLPFDKAYFLEIKVGTEVMSPRQRIASAGYAFKAESSEQADRIKADPADPLAGYLSEKTDTASLEVDAAGHKIRVKDAGINKLKLKTAVGEIAFSSPYTETVRVSLAEGTNSTYLPSVYTTMIMKYGTSTGISSCILPGGEYGFFPQIKYINNATVYIQQRYVTASGRDCWIFLLVDKSSQEIVAGYVSKDHPSYGNGGDPAVVTHPFGDYDPQNQEIVLLDKKTAQELEEEAGQGDGSILTLINERYAVNMTKTEKYTPLHTGKFIDKDPEMVDKLPDYITVRSLVRLAEAEKTGKETTRQKIMAQKKTLKNIKEKNKASAVKKLVDLGLSNDEILALTEN